MVLKIMNSLILLSAVDSDAFNIYEFYAKKFSELYVDPKIFIEYNLILLIAFVIRMYVLINIESKKKNKNDKERHNKYMYIFGHIGIEWFIATIFTYFVVKSTNAMLDSYIINLMIAPFLGFILAVYIDLKFLIPAEAGTVMGSLNSKSESSKKDDNTSINININNGQVEETKKKNELSTITDEKLSKLSEELLEDEERFDSTILNAINNIVTTQNEHNRRIKETENKLDGIVEIMNQLRESDMIDKQITLKHMIYECLNNGFATPEENDKITKLYYAYHNLLGGNHEVETLYEDHYLKLPIHEDHRYVDVPVVNDRRRSKVIEYGSLDSI